MVWVGFFAFVLCYFLLSLLCGLCGVVVVLFGVFVCVFGTVFFMTSVNSFVKQVGVGVKRGSLPSEFGVWFGGDPLLLEKIGVTWVFHVDGGCSRIRSSLVLRGFDDAPFLGCVGCCVGLREFRLLVFCSELVALESACLRVLKLDGVDLKVVNKRLSSLRVSRGVVKRLWDGLVVDFGVGGLGVGLDGAVDGVFDLFDEAVGFLNGLLVSDSVVEGLLVKGREFVCDGLEGVFVDEGLVLCGVVRFKFLNKFLLGFVEAFRVGGDSGGRWVVLLLPRFMYDFFQREVFRSKANCGWVGCVSVDGVGRGVLDTVVGLWDPLSGGLLADLSECLVVAEEV